MGVGGAAGKGGAVPAPEADGAVLAPGDQAVAERQHTPGRQPSKIGVGGAARKRGAVLAPEADSAISPADQAVAERQHAPDHAEVSVGGAAGNRGTI